MKEKKRKIPFEPQSGKSLIDYKKSKIHKPRNEAIPDYVARRIARRVAFFTGLPTFAGMGVFVVSYLLKSNEIADIAPGLTMIGSGLFFLLGIFGLSFGVLSASWEPKPGTLIGIENVKINLKRIKESVRSQRQIPNS